MKSALTTSKFRFSIIVATAFATSISSAVADQSPYLARMNFNMNWSAWTSQEACESESSRPCVLDYFCGTEFWFPRTSVDGLQGYSGSTVYRQTIGLPSALT